MADNLEMIVDFDSVAEKRMLMTTLSAMKGKRRVEVIDYRRRRTDRQCRYYFPAFVHEFAEFLRAQGERVLDHEVHDLFRERFLSRSVANPLTGEYIGTVVRSTTELSTVEFNDYLDRIACWLADSFGIVVPPPDVYREKDDEPQPKRKARAA